MTHEFLKVYLVLVGGWTFLGVIAGIVSAKQNRKKGAGIDNQNHNADYLHMYQHYDNGVWREQRGNRIVRGDGRERRKPGFPRTTFQIG